MDPRRTRARPRSCSSRSWRWCSTHDTSGWTSAIPITRTTPDESVAAVRGPVAAGAAGTRRPRVGLGAPPSPPVAASAGQRHTRWCVSHLGVFCPASMRWSRVFFVGERYRLPLFVPLCVSAGGALDWMLRAFRSTSELDLAPRLPAAIFVFVMASTVTFWPFGLDEGRFDERLRLSKVLMNRGDYGLAAMELERAHAIDPSHTIAEFNLGMALISSGRAAEGIAHVRRAVDEGVAMPGARYALAGRHDGNRRSRRSRRACCGPRPQRRKTAPRAVIASRCWRWMRARPTSPNVTCAML